MRLPPHGPRLVSRARGLWRTLRGTWGADTEGAAPLVSVVVPFYGVEDYIRECLASIAAQDLDDMEVLLVDDGSRDGSRAIAEEFVEADARFRLLTRPNGGLGAARNTGVQEARGRYLTFADSDDRLAPGAVRVLVDSLEGSGSDIAVGAPERFDHTRTWTSPWVRDVHGVRRTGTSAEVFPALLRNFYTWNKLFRRDFFIGQGLWFREGVAYEDQPIITQLLVRARAVDVLPDVVYQYRAREDQSSISQQSATIADLRARLEAWRLTHDVIRSEMPDAIHQAWLQTLFDAHFGWYLTSDGTTDDTYWSEIRDAVVRYASEASEAVWEASEPPRRVLVTLAMQDRREDLRAFAERDGLRMDTWPSRPERDGILVELPLLDDPALERRLFLLHPDQWKVAHAIEQLHRVDGPDGPGVRLAGWAHLDGIDQTGWGAGVEVALRSRRTGQQHVYAARRGFRPATPPPSQRAGVDERTDGFAVEVPIADVARGSRDGDEWDVLLSLRAGEATMTAPVTAVRRTGSAGSPVFATAGQRSVSVHWRPGEVLRFRADPAGAEVATVATEGRRVVGRMTSPTAGATLVAVGLASQGERSAPLDGEGRFELELPLDGQPVPGHFRDWRLLLGTDDRTEIQAPWPAPLPAPGSSVAVVPGPSGRLLLREWSLGAAADSVEVQPDGAITVTGRVLGPSAGRARLSIGEDDTGLVGAVEELRDGRFTVRGRLQTERHRFGPHPLPVGQYELGVVVTRDEGDVRVPLVASDTMATSLPAVVDTDTQHARLVRGLRGHLRLALSPPVGEARGARRQRLLRREFRVRERHEDLVLLRSCGGRAADGDALALHRELRRRSELPLLWAVEDHSVPLPDGAHPVVVNSPEWYDVLARARYLVSDSAFPVFFARSSDQVLLRVWSGRPGMLDEVGRGRDVTEWDHVLAPSQLLATHLRTVRPDWDLLELGSPRADPLLSPDAADIRKATRASLGVTGHDRVVLHAPGAPGPDAPELARRLGAGYVVLAAGATGRGCVDVSDYPLWSDLHLAADVAIVGDVAVALDFALTGKPMVLPDRTHGPVGGAVPLPGVRVDSAESLVDAIVGQVEQPPDGGAERYDAFRRTHLYLEDGRASGRVVDALLAEGIRNA